jgi:hypothetical protein
MDRRKVFKSMGLFLFIIGLALLANSFSGITGFVVFEGGGRAAGSVLGIVFVIGGIIIFTIIDDIVSDSEAHNYDKSTVGAIVRHERKPTYAAPRHKPLFPRSLKEAVEQGKVHDYLSRKDLVFMTNYHPHDTSKHTKLLGTKLTTAEAKKRAETYAGSQFLPQYNTNQIHQIERRIIEKNRAQIREDNHVIFYGVGHSEAGGEITGFERGRREVIETGGLAVDVIEEGNTIMIHSYPVSIKDAKKYNKRGA